MKPLLLLLFALPCLAIADGLPTVPYIYVEGKAEIEKPADMVTLSFELSSRDLNQGKANKAVQALANKIFELLKSAKVEDKDVTASDLKSEQEYEEESDSNRHRKFIGYRVTRPFEVKVHNLPGFPKLVDDLMNAGVTSFSGITEGLTDEKELKDNVWDKAVADARERAEKTLKVTGSRIASLFAISPISFPQISPAIFGASNSYGESYEAAQIPAAKAEPSQYRIQPVKVSQSVHVIYLLETPK